MGSHCPCIREEFLGCVPSVMGQSQQDCVLGPCVRLFVCRSFPSQVSRKIVTDVAFTLSLGQSNEVMSVRLQA